ncbi:MAG: bifunctional diguanylate cyclase/phosphodiesterase [Devosia sp.]
MGKVSSSAQARGVSKALVFNIVAGVVIAAVFAASVYWSLRSISSDLTRSATTVADRWYEASIGRNSKVERLLQGEGLSVDEELRIAAATRVGNVLGYQIFAPTGFVVRSSSGTMRYDRRMGQIDRQSVDRAMRTGRPVSQLVRVGEGDEMAVKVYEPVLRKMGAIAVVAVIVDKSAAYALSLQKLERSLVFAALLATLGLGSTVSTAWLLQRQRASDERIRHLAHHDGLTGVANRGQFLTLLRNQFAASQASRQTIAVHMVDLDHFKTVNDTLGHEAGDRLLQQVAATMVECAGAGDMVARLGGDEFALVQILEGAPEGAETRAASLVEAIGLIQTINGTAARVSVSIGTALSSQATSPEELQRIADAALYHAKTGGRDQFVLFQDGMDEVVRHRTAMRNRLRQALDTNQFELFYQPLHDANTGTIVSFEALLRLPDDDGGYLSPDEFVPLAEELGMTPELGRWVLWEAARAACQWPSHIQISVNMSPQQFEEDVVSIVDEVLTTTGLAPERLEIEITENLFIRDAQNVERQLHKLRDLGISIVMDDFGTGYSSLQYLWRFPFDKLKVDRSCFRSLGEREEVAEILRTISAMSCAMNLRVTAEGIETAAQREFAREAGYDEIQGYLYSRPMPSADIAGYIAEARIGTEPGAHDNGPKEAQVVPLPVADKPSTRPASAGQEDSPRRSCTG